MLSQVRELLAEHENNFRVALADAVDEIKSFLPDNLKGLDDTDDLAGGDNLDTDEGGEKDFDEDEVSQETIDAAKGLLHDCTSDD